MTVVSFNVGGQQFSHVRRWNGSDDIMLKLQCSSSRFIMHPTLLKMHLSQCPDNTVHVQTERARKDRTDGPISLPLSAGLFNSPALPPLHFPPLLIGQRLLREGMGRAGPESERERETHWGRELRRQLSPSCLCQGVKQRSQRKLGSLEDPRQFVPMCGCTHTHTHSTPFKACS